MRFIKASTAFLLAVLLLWGGLVLFMPKDDGVFYVVLDPGHGGKDPGAVVDGIMEKDINLAIALLVQDNLAGREGVVVSMTRDQDTYPTLTQRAEYANELDADLFVSIHANALEDDTTYAGVMTFYHPDKPDSKNLARLIQTSVLETTNAIDRGIRSENYVVITETDMPAALVETGFMTCPEELSLLVDPGYQAKLAEGIAAGILAFQ